MRAALKFRIAFEPSIQCLFRTEEVIDRSATAEKHNGAGRLCLDDLPLVENDSNSTGTVGRRIINRDFLRRKFVADQRQKIDRSVSIENPARGKRHPVKL